jgi:hypothetical protein
MNGPLNPAARVPTNRNVVLHFRVPMSKGDGGYFIPVIHVGYWLPAQKLFWITNQEGNRSVRIPIEWLKGWSEIPAEIA